MTFQLKVLKTLDEFASVENYWVNMENVGVSTIFLTYKWLREWWNYFCDNHNLYTLVLWADTDLVGILPLMITRSRFGFRKLEFMGSGDVTPNHLDVISKPEYRSDVLEAFSTHLYEQCSEWDVLELDKIAGDSNLAEYQKKYFENVHLLTELDKTAHCPYVELPASIDLYLQTLSQRKRRNLRKSKRALENNFSSISYRLVNDEKDLKHVMERLIQLHQERWEARGFPGAFATKNFKEFHQSIALLLLKKNQLRLNYLELNEKIVAVQYCYQINGCVQGYLQSFDASFADYSLGSLMTIHDIEQAINLGVHQFDFLEGEEAYKNEWATQNRINYRLRVYGPTWRGKVLHMINRTYKAIMGIATRYIHSEIRGFLWRIIQRTGIGK